ncbi:MAG: UDP-glucose dehydrogenase family protein [Pseudorhizobium sp.]
MQIVFFGIGYVGLVQAAVFAEAGYRVMCVDIDATKVADLKAGKIPIYEPGLEALVRENVKAGHLLFTTDPKDAVAFSPLQFIAVGTPPDEDGSADLRHVLTVARSIARHMDEAKTVVVKSTVPVGTADKVRAAMAAELRDRGRPDLGFDVASNPEFLKEGSAVADCTKPDRIIIGTDNLQTEQQLRELYAPFNRNHEKIIAMDVRSAELTKYAANCMLATKISFMNEMANLADRFGADIEKVRMGIGADPRIGYHFIYPGIGYGGSCFPKDVRATIRTAEADGFDPLLLKAVEARNEMQKSFLFTKILSYFGGDLRGRTFAMWGLAFKPKTDDMRDAPSRVLMEALWQAGARVQAYDPAAMEECRRIYGERPDLQLCEGKEATLAGADGLLVVTEWKQFQAPDFSAIRAMLREPVIFDGRNIYDPAIGLRHGLEIHPVGRLRPSPLIPLHESVAAE